MIKSIVWFELIVWFEPMDRSLNQSMSRCTIITMPMNNHAYYKNWQPYEGINAVNLVEKNGT